MNNSIYHCHVKRAVTDCRKFNLAYDYSAGFSRIARCAEIFPTIAKMLLNATWLQPNPRPTWASLYCSRF